MHVMASNFNNFLKKLTGTIPKEYRKMLKTKV